MCPKARWYEVLSDVFLSLRILPTTTTGYSAFELTYKQTPHLPLPLHLRSAPLEEYPLGWEKDLSLPELE